MLLRKYNINFTTFTTGKNKNHFIRIRVTCMGQRVDLSTGISIQPSQWDKKKQQVKQGVLVNNTPYNYINAALDSYKAFITDYFLSCATRDTNPSLDELKGMFNRKYRMTGKQQADEFFYLFDQFIEEKSKERTWKKSMNDTYVRLKDMLHEFNPNLKFSDLSVATMNAILQHMSKTMYNDSIKKRLSHLKSFVKWAQYKKYGVNEEFFNFNPRLPESKTAVKYLELDELNRIIDLQLEPSVEKVRDMFVFMCFTAMRYSDLHKFKHENIIHDSATGDYYVVFLATKDRDRLEYRLPKKAVEIYEKYKDNSYDDGLVFPVISNQKFNDHLKTIGKLAKLEGEWIDYQFRLAEEIKVKTPKADLESHTARRTFIVTAINEGVAPSLIIQITGHSDYKAMKPYIEKTRRGTSQVIDALDKASNP